MRSICQGHGDGRYGDSDRDHDKSKKSGLHDMLTWVQSVAVDLSRIGQW